jgi:hypothetical protein
MSPSIFDKVLTSPAELERGGRLVADLVRLTETANLGSTRAELTALITALIVLGKNNTVPSIDLSAFVLQAFDQHYPANDADVTERKDLPK